MPAGAPHIVIVGPGALGIVTAVRLANAAAQVTLAARSAEKARVLAGQGLRLDVVGGQSEHAMLPVVAAPEELAQPADVLIIATKCRQALAAAESWLPALSHDGILVPFQNGLMGETFAALAGERLVECVVYYPASLLATGHARLTGPGHLHFGQWPAGPVTPAVERVAELLSPVLPTFTHADMFSVKWNKLVANSAMTSLAVISGLEMGGMMRHGVIRKVLLAVVEESLTVAKAAGATPMPLGAFDPERIVKLPRWIAGVGLRIATRKHGAYKSSGQQSLERGEPTEVDYLNGRVFEEAARLGLPAPLNGALVSAVHEVERKPETAGIGRVRELLAR